MKKIGRMYKMHRIIMMWMIWMHVECTRNTSYGILDRTLRKRAYEDSTVHVMERQTVSDADYEQDIEEVHEEDVRDAYCAEEPLDLSMKRAKTECAAIEHAESGGSSRGSSGTLEVIEIQDDSDSNESSKEDAQSEVDSASQTEVSTGMSVPDSKAEESSSSLSCAPTVCQSSAGSAIYVRDYVKVHIHYASNRIYASTADTETEHTKINESYNNISTIKTIDSMFKDAIYKKVLVLFDLGKLRIQYKFLGENGKRYNYLKTIEYVLASLKYKHIRVVENSEARQKDKLMSKQMDNLHSALNIGTTRTCIHFVDMTADPIEVCLRNLVMIDDAEITFTNCSFMPFECVLNIWHHINTISYLGMYNCRQPAQILNLLHLQEHIKVNRLGYLPLGRDVDRKDYKSIAELIVHWGGIHALFVNYRFLLYLWYHCGISQDLKINTLMISFINLRSLVSGFYSYIHKNYKKHKLGVLSEQMEKLYSNVYFGALRTKTQHVQSIQLCVVFSNSNYYMKYMNLGYREYMVFLLINMFRNTTKINMAILKHHSYPKDVERMQNIIAKMKNSANTDTSNIDITYNGVVVS